MESRDMGTIITFSVPMADMNSTSSPLPRYEFHFYASVGNKVRAFSNKNFIHRG